MTVAWRRSWLAYLLVALIAEAAVASEDPGNLHHALHQLADQVQPQVVAWRRDIHQHPELANREFRTARLVAEHLRHIGLDQVRTGIAYTGVVGVLRGGHPGPVVALRADMDALPVQEALDLPYASRVRTIYRGEETAVMHACGHDAHVAILLGVATVLAELRAQLPGSVVFIFQPAEEGPPQGEDGGAALMLKEGAFADPRPEAIFALHVANDPPGVVSYRAGGINAASLPFDITLHRTQAPRQAFGQGGDALLASAHLILALQALVSREVDAILAPSVVTIGRIRTQQHGAEVELSGMARTLHPDLVPQLRRRLPELARGTASAHAVKAEFQFRQDALPVNFTDPALLERMLPTLERSGNARGTFISPAQLGAEDFGFFAEEVPGLYFYMGVNPEGKTAAQSAPNHSPYFFVNDEALVYGVRMLSALAYDYLRQG